MMKFGSNIELDEFYNKASKKIFSVNDINKGNIIEINRIYDKDFKLLGYDKIYL